MRAKSAPEGCPSRVVDARRRPPIVHSLHHPAVRPQRRRGRAVAGPRRPPGCRHGSPDRSPARRRARAARRRRRPGGRLAAAARARGGRTRSTRPTRPTARATAASTCSARWASRCWPRCPARSPSPASLAGRGVVVVDHGATRTTYEPVGRDGRRRHARSRAGAQIGTLAAGRVPLLPARLPALGLDRGRDLPRPAPPGRRRPGAAAAAVARRAGSRPVLLDQPDRVAGDVRRPRGEVCDRVRGT